MSEPHPQIVATLHPLARSSVELRLRNESSEPAFAVRYLLPERLNDSDNVFELRPPARFRGLYRKRPAPARTDCVVLNPGEEVRFEIDLATWYELPEGSTEVRYLAFHDFPVTLQATLVASNWLAVRVEP